MEQFILTNHEVKELTLKDGFEPCLQCNYSAPPLLHSRELKHFNPHWAQCQRCGYQTKTYKSEGDVKHAWNYIERFDQQRGWGL